MSANPRVGVVGAGGIAHPHVAAWRRLGARVQIYSTDGQAASVAGQYGASEAPTLDALIADCDVVDVCTPTFVHDEIVFAAAEAGRDIVCEKPLARTHARAAQMIEVCRAAGVQMYPGQVVRYFAEYATAQAAVAAGRIGQPAVLRLYRRGATPVREWFADPGLSGGILVDQMIHDFDYARWVAGEVSAVYAKVLGGQGRPARGYAVLSHDSGALSHVTGSWGPPHTAFATSFTLSGSAGRLHHSTAERPALRWDAPGLDDAGGALLPDFGGVDSPFLTELSEFAAAFRGGPAPRVSAEDGLAALDIALAAVQSAATGRAVSPKEVAQ